MGCYVKLQIGYFWITWKVGHGKGKWVYSNGIFTYCSRTGNSNVLNNILPFSLMFHLAKKLLYFDILKAIFNKFDDNFVFACIFPNKFPLFTMN